MPLLASCSVIADTKKPGIAGLFCEAGFVQRMLT
jgi:hypothetical protein